MLVINNEKLIKWVQSKQLHENGQTRKDDASWLFWVIFQLFKKSQTNYPRVITSRPKGHLPILDKNSNVRFREIEDQKGKGIYHIVAFSA